MLFNFEKIKGKKNFCATDSFFANVQRDTENRNTSDSKGFLEKKVDYKKRANYFN